MPEMLQVGITGGTSVIAAVANCVGSVVLAAVKVTICCAEIEAGAV